MALGLLATMQSQAANLQVTVSNLTHGDYFTPLLIAGHDSATHLFQLGSPASLALQKMAEGGDLADLTTSLQGVGADLVSNPANGVLAPGASITASLTTTANNTHLSVVAMILPTNDGFVGIDALSIPTVPGTYHYDLNAYDAGTEANNELIVSGSGAPNTLGIPADPGSHNGSNATGVTTVETNTNVHVHRGVLGDTNATGGTSDLDATIHRWLNPIARLTIVVQ
ncbi:MAG: hypothetical protein D6698_02170 [Gammaproteobacteria bacterium]|nr:MAG: hypothetical protein D6698_02170 [Gammaproteobacteria bacterium]